jgi:hypothetical protein
MILLINLHAQMTVSPAELPLALAGIVKAVAELKGHASSRWAGERRALCKRASLDCREPGRGREACHLPW